MFCTSAHHYHYLVPCNNNKHKFTHSWKTASDWTVSMNGSGCSFQQTFVGKGQSPKNTCMGGYPIIIQTLQTWSFIPLLSVWISHETISCCVVFNILHGEKICAVLGKNMANINSNRFQQVLKDSLQRKFHQR